MRDHTTRSASLLVLGCTFAALGAADGWASLIHVDAAAPAGGTGASWLSPFNDLQDALTLAAQLAGTDQIRIAGGTYVPSLAENPPNPRTATFVLTSQLQLLGGYAGWGSPNPDARDPELFPTILSGDLAGNDGPGFQGNAENCYHVVTAMGVDDSLIMDGLIIRGGNANAVMHSAGGGMLLSGSPFVSMCVIESNAASQGGGIFVESGDPTLVQCVIRANQATFDGGGLGVEGASITLDICMVQGNVSGPEYRGGGIFGHDVESAMLRSCTFAGNIGGVGGGLNFHDSCAIALEGTAVVGNQAMVGGGGAVIDSCGALKVLGCEFRDNDGESAFGGLLGNSEVVSCVDSLFISNTSGHAGGGATLVTAAGSVHNCVVVSNASGQDGGLLCVGPVQVINSTIAGNIGGGVSASDEPVHLTNAIVWGNQQGQIVGPRVVMQSNVQGGAMGIGNINQDPLFVQPGTGDVRLSYGSPCVDAGSDAALPADACDIDGDGDVVEPLPLDLAGGPRIIGPHVDMGAYEGEHDADFPAAMAGDIDQGEQVTLLPLGGAPNPLVAPLVVFTNTLGPDNASAIVTLLPRSVHAGAGGFSGLGDVLRVETTLEDGHFLALLMMPITLGDLNGAAPFDVDATGFDSSAEAWRLAVLDNAGPVGLRILVQGPGFFGVTQDPGDFGVYWDPTIQAGFAWANVDHAGDFSFGVNPCPTDCQPPGGDGAVDVTDYVSVVLAWGQANPLCDVNRDGVVEAIDLIAVVGMWGTCP